ncbi:hypothetical protein MKX03_033946, partial [Papaver bracteatum]
PAVENMAKKHYPSVHTNEPAVCGKNVEVENFDDFGIDLYPAPETPLLESDLDDDKVNCTSSIHANKEIPRCSGSGPSVVKHQNIEKSDPSEGIPKVQVMLKSKMEEHKKLNEVVDERSLVIPKADLPSELRCSLCNSIFKEAVMIPCCQHNFCDKCICSAIEHFLESQGLVSGSDNIFQKFAPDEASGIQAKEFGCRAVWCLFKFAGLVTEFAGFLMSQNLEERLHIVVKPIPVADETLSESGSTQSNLRLDSLIIEAIANLKERNGSNRTSIATYM